MITASRAIVGFAAALLPLANASPADQLLPVCQKERYGFVDLRGTWVIPARYENAGRFSDGLAPVMIESLWGYIAADGKIHVTPRYKEASPFSNGLAQVRESSEYGYIDRRGKYVVEPSFEQALPFSEEGLALVKKRNEWFFINREGQPVIRGDYERLRPFSEGLAPARIHGAWGYIDERGTWVIEPQFRDAWSFSDGLAAVRDSRLELYGFIDRTGHFRIRPQFGRAASFSEGLAAVRGAGREKDLEWKYIDREGAERIPGPFVEARQFRNLAALVRDGVFGRWLYISRSGRPIVRDDRPALAGPSFVSVKVSSEPAGASAYFVPLSTADIDPDVLKDAVRLELEFLVTDGRTIVTTEVVPKAFIVLFRKDGFEETQVTFEATPGKQNLQVNVTLKRQRDDG